MPSKILPKSVRPADLTASLPVTSFVDAKGHSFSVSTTSAREAFDTTGYSCITLWCLGCDSVIRLGDSSVVAATTDQGFSALCPDGTPVDLVINDIVNQTHIAAVAISGSGTMYITYRS